MRKTRATLNGRNYWQKKTLLAFGVVSIGNQRNQDKNKKTEAKGVGKALKGKAQQATGKARRAAKKHTR